MMNRVVLLICVFCFVGSNVTAQTKMIFHKSHSGTSWDFAPDGQGNRGEMDPFPLLQSIVRLNDSTIVFISDYSDGTKGRDTLVNHPHWNMIDSSNFDTKFGFEEIQYKDLSNQSQQNVRKKEEKKKSSKRKK